MLSLLFVLGSSLVALVSSAGSVRPLKHNLIVDYQKEAFANGDAGDGLPFLPRPAAADEEDGENEGARTEYLSYAVDETTLPEPDTTPVQEAGMSPQPLPEPPEVTEAPQSLPEPPEVTELPQVTEAPPKVPEVTETSEVTEAPSVPNVPEGTERTTMPPTEAPTEPPTTTTPSTTPTTTTTTTTQPPPPPTTTPTSAPTTPPTAPRSPPVASTRSTAGTTFITRRPVVSTREPPPVPDQSPNTLEGASCDFGVYPEPTLCSWSSNANASLMWHAGTGNGANWLGGPGLDINSHTIDGGYVFMETSQPPKPSAESSGALLESVELGTTGSQGTCLHFGYSIDGLSPAELRVLLRPIHPPDDDATLEAMLNAGPAEGRPRLEAVAVRPGTDLELLAGGGPVGRGTVLWQAQYRPRGSWEDARLLYTFQGPHKLAFEGIPVATSDPVRAYRGFIAVDAVKLRPGGACQGFCTFAAGFCDWSNEPLDDFDWSLSRGSHNPATGPTSDSASAVGGMASAMGGGAGGGYAFIDSSYPRRPGDKARLVSMAFPQTGESGPMCLRFWFHMFGPAVGTLRVLLRRFFQRSTSSEVNHEIWALTGNAGNAWFMAEVTVASVPDFQVVFEATVGNTAMGDIAVDDVAFAQGPCPAAPQVAAPLTGDCTFEVDECGWTSTGNRERVMWERLPARTQDVRHRRRPLNSPQATHRHNDYYLNLSRRLLLSKGSTTQFTSREFPGSEEPSCLSFWYFMHEPFIDVSGPSLGVLRVLLQTMGDNSRPLLTPLWQLFNNQGPAWSFARTTIAQSTKYKVIFEGIWGPNRSSGSIAIDDIAFYDGSCDLSPPHAALRPEDCSFERSLCAWHNWTRVRPGERAVSWQRAFDTHRPAQLQDKTFGTSDGYIFFDIFATNLEQRMARLVSPLVRPRPGEDTLCFAFWFAAFGAGDSTHLQLLRFPSSGELDEQAGTPVWRLTAEGLDTTRPAWAPAQVTLDNRKPLRLVLEGSASNGGFSVDDIRLLPGPCEIRPKNANPE